MAKALIDGMTNQWEPEKYKDDYRQALHKLIDEKLEHGGELPGKPKPKAPTRKVIDLVAVLKESLAQTEAARKKAGKALGGVKKSPRKAGRKGRAA